ncbi:YlxR family protein [Gordonia alkaliphila]|uniref:YlxR domain-containing protein n=1 Tax=Gordonia alkaliphila TaxID=1053547 RepID=A0ABP8YVX5_9ACTN
MLVRVAVNAKPELVIDHRKNLPGRGAWLHPSESCVTTAVRRRAFGPALRVRGLTVDPADLAEIFGEAP